MSIHLLCCSWGFPSWNALPASIAGGSPKLHSCIHTSPFRVLGKQKSYFGCSRVIISVYEEESYPGCAAKVLRRWNVPEGAWDGDEAMASSQALPEGSCTRTRWTGPSFVCGLRRPRSPHPCNGATLAEGTENVALRDLCQICAWHSARPQDRTIKAQGLVPELVLPKALAFPAEPQ